MKEKIIEKLYELKEYFTRDKESLESYIYLLKNNTYSLEFENSLKDFLVNNIFMQSFSVCYRNQEELSYLYFNLKTYEDVKYRVRYNEKENVYKTYPVKKDQKLIIEACNKVIRSLIDEYLSSTISLKDIIHAYFIYAQTKLENFKNQVKNSKMEVYCGDEDFIENRIRYIYSCIAQIINSNEVLIDKTDFIKSINDIYKLYTDMINENKNISDSFVKYENLEQCYKTVLAIENNLSINMQQIWDSYLTNPVEYISGTPYKFLVSVLTKGYVKSNDLTKLCCTLVTDKCMPIPFGDYGYIVPFDINSLGTICTSDAGSWKINADDFINRNFISEWQLYEKCGDEYVYYETPELSKLILPWNLEKTMLENNNNNLYGSRYSEIFLENSNGNIKTNGMFALNQEKYDLINSYNDLPKILFDNTKNNKKTK